MKHYEILVDDNGLSYSQSAPPLHWQQRADSHDAISNAFASQRVFFHNFDNAYWQDWHPLPNIAKRMTVMLAGSMQVTTGKGESIVVSAGDCITFYDFHGQGHQTQGLTEGYALIVDLE